LSQLFGITVDVEKPLTMLVKICARLVMFWRLGATAEQPLASSE
jgi:hypothetical protein